MTLSKRVSENFIYLFIWLIVCSLPVFTLRGGDNFSGTKIVMELFRMLPFLLIFIINNSILVPRFLFKKKNIQYIVYISFSIVAISIVFDSLHFMQEFTSYPPPLNHPPRFDAMSPPPMPPVQHLKLGGKLIDMIIISFLLVGFNSAVKLSFKQQLEEQQIEEQKKIHVQTELSFLKNQISPHFFMNTLNNIHALVDISTEETKDAIIKLSKMMGFMLYESRTDKIMVQKEMEFVRSYVELMRLRFTDDIEILLDISEKLPSISIPPLLTISFIENAFKHGVSYEEPSFVHINFSFTNDEMFFEIRNSIHTKRENNENSGIGLENSKNRLGLIFGDKYKLSINQLPGNVFSVTLNIPI